MFCEPLDWCWQDALSDASDASYRSVSQSDLSGMAKRTALPQPLSHRCSASEHNDDYSVLYYSVLLCL